jgi:hypothetical protein
MRGFLKSRVWPLVLALLAAGLPFITNANASYVFSAHTFTNCSAVGKTGPTQTACRSAYSTTWDESNSNFTVTSGIQNWTVPTSGYYYIDAYGAGGGGLFAGGGARIADTFLLTQGETIKILVGQVGETNTAASANSGAGGTFVIRTPYNTNGSILLIAGGGGGSESGSSQRSEAHASITTSGNNGFAGGGGSPAANTSGAGGTLGNGGGAASTDNSGGGGGGFLTNGTTNANWENAGGIAFVNGGAGGAGGVTFSSSNDGGFGGGGAAAGKGNGGGPGGGGGYSGGGGGDNIANGAGGGGGSYFANGLNTNRITTVNGNAAQSQGYVTITFLSAATTATTLAIAGNVSSAEYNKSIVVTATVDNPGKVTFRENGRKIANCVGRAATTTVACTWKPKIRGNVLITASLAPTNVSLSGSTSSAIKLFITSRSSSR